ncbi:hypothetical protein GOBAR_AA18071 [Gossypium barbadense]|uniref:Uncharacterized protein n=1 Tax=Gossypium barbadense TaxID=3634 RepID=A0A2P5XGW5_GOSBA|nr:hypothetical protein GOBAR_AA18071 [Gossypium barbadense]
MLSNFDVWIRLNGVTDNASGGLDFNGIRGCWCWCYTIITRFRTITISNITCVFRARRRESKTSSVAVGEGGDETSSRYLTSEEYPLLVLGLSLLLGLGEEELEVDGDFEGEDALEGTGEGDDLTTNAPTTTMKTSASQNEKHLFSIPFAAHGYKFAFKPYQTIHQTLSTTRA